MARPKRDGTPAKQNMTERQILFLSHLPHSASPQEAAVKAGYPVKGVGQTTLNLMKSPNIQAALLADMSAEGINGRSLARYMRHGMDAKQYSMTKEGDVVELGPDWNARYKIMELIAKVSGAMPDGKLEVSGPGGGAVVIRHTIGLDGD